MIKKFLEKLLELRVTPARGHKHCLWRTPTRHVIPAPTPPLIPQLCSRELRFYQDRAMRTSSYATRRGKLNLGHWGQWWSGWWGGWRVGSGTPTALLAKSSKFGRPHQGKYSLLPWACGLSELSGGAASNVKGRSWKWEDHRGARYALLTSVANGETTSMRRGRQERAQQRESASSCQRPERSGMTGLKCWGVEKKWSTKNSTVSRTILQTWRQNKDIPRYTKIENLFQTDLVYRKYWKTSYRLKGNDIRIRLKSTGRYEDYWKR